MGTVTPKVALGVFLLILVIALSVSIFSGGHGGYDSSKIRVFISVLAGFSVVVTFMFYYGVVELQQQEQELASVEETARLNQDIIKGISDQMSKTVSLAPSFVLSLSPLTADMTANTPSDSDSPEAHVAKLLLARKIFFSWQDILISNKFVKLSRPSCISMFLQMATSQSLKEYWDRISVDFNDNTRKSVEILFDRAKDIEWTVDSFDRESKELAADREFIAYFQS